MPAKGRYKNPSCSSCGKKKPTDLRKLPRCGTCAAFVKKLRRLRRDFRATREERLAADRAYYAANAARIRAQKRAAYAKPANAARDKAQAKVRYLRNRKKRIAQASARNKILRIAAPSVIRGYEKATNKRYPHKRAAMAARRRATQVDATPHWSDRRAIDNIYALAVTMTEVLGKPYHVDHIVPLTSRRVSGLHVPANLQILSEEENRAKSNKRWPGMA